MIYRCFGSGQATKNVAGFIAFFEEILRLRGKKGII
jgi:hypothetical protein